MFLLGKAGFCLPKIRLATLLALAAPIVLGACAAPLTPSLGETHAGFGSSPEERKLLADARRIGDELKQKGLVFDDPALQSYLNEIGSRVANPAAAAVSPPRLFAMRSAQINAFALPNGEIYVTLGLLAALPNEAQLAMVLAHEYAHVELRHSLQAHEIRRNSVFAAHIADLFLLGTGLAYLPALTGVSSFNREQEREADRIALERLHLAGYSGAEGIEAFNSMAAANPGGDGAAGSAYNSHPDNRERVELLKALLKAAQPQGSASRIGLEDYRRRRVAVLAEAIRLCLRGGRFERAYALGGEARGVNAQHAWPFALQGEARRMMSENPRAAADDAVRGTRKPADDATVQKFKEQREVYLTDADQLFQEALRLDPDDADALRGIGLILRARGDLPQAKTYLERYLGRRPDAPDRLFIATLLRGGS